MQSQRIAEAHMTNNFAGNHATTGIDFDNSVLKDANTFKSKMALSSVYLVKDTEAASIIGVSKATWWRRVADGTMPQPIRFGSITRWKLSEITAAIEKLATDRPPAPAPERAVRAHKPEGQSKLDKVYLRKKEAEL